MPLKDRAEMMGYSIFHLKSFSRAAKLSKRGNTAVGDAARHDESEMAEVRPVVKRESVTGHPARDSNPNGGKFFLTDPNSGQAVNSPTGNPVIRRDPNDHFLEVSNVTVHIASIGFEVDDWVTDDLPGPVIGDIAATPGLEHFDAARRERFRRRQDVRTSTIAPDAQGQNRRVLDQQQDIWNAIRATLFDESALQRQRFVIRYRPEPPNLQGFHTDVQLWGSAFRRILSVASDFSRTTCESG